MPLPIAILKSYEDVEPLIDLARAGADTERDALGFLPPNAYKQAAEQGKLFVAVNGEGEYLGHLMFGGVFPHGKVMQIYSKPESRKHGVAQAIMDELVKYAQERGFLSLSAKVASDLSKANAFYGRMGFQTVKTLPGGKTRNRLIYYRVRDLDTPSLFDLMVPQSGDHLPNLGMSGNYSSKTPIYAIDLNVLFDVSLQRARGKDAGMVIRAATSGEIRMVITEEFIEELKRTSQKFPNDPHLQFALQMKVLKAPKAKEIKGIEEELAGIIFPERSSQGILSTQDRSDLRHLATAIHRGITGFITSEKAILRAHDFLRSKYSLDVLGVSDFADAMASDENEVAPDQVALADETELTSSSLTEELSKDAISFLRTLHVPYDTIETAMSQGDSVASRRHLVLSGENGIVSFSSWALTQNPRRIANVLVFADESLPTARTAIDYTLDQVCKAASSGAPARVCLCILPGHPETRKIALTHGFRPEPGQEVHGTTLHKLSVGGVIDEQSWESTRRALMALANIELPRDIPAYVAPDQSIIIKTSSGQDEKIPLQELETLLTPAIILLPGRSGTIASIRRIYADDLLGTGKQLSIFSSAEAVLLKERVFYSSPNNTALFAPGTPVLFYESSPGRGRSSVVALGRATTSHILTSDQLNSDTKRKGVLDRKDFELIGKSKFKLVTGIDNIMVFRNPVPLDKLHDIGCTDGANFIKAKPIEHHHLKSIINIGLK